MFAWFCHSLHGACLLHGSGSQEPATEPPPPRRHFSAPQVQEQHAHHAAAAGGVQGPQGPGHVDHEEAAAVAGEGRGRLRAMGRGAVGWWCVPKLGWLASVREWFHTGFATNFATHWCQWFPHCNAPLLVNQAVLLSQSQSLAVSTPGTSCAKKRMSGLHSSVVMSQV